MVKHPLATLLKKSSKALPPPPTPAMESSTSVEEPSPQPRSPPMFSAVGPPPPPPTTPSPPVTPPSPEVALDPEARAPPPQVLSAAQAWLSVSAQVAEPKDAINPPQVHQPKFSPSQPRITTRGQQPPLVPSPPLALVAGIAARPPQKTPPPPPAPSPVAVTVADKSPSYPPSGRSVADSILATMAAVGGPHMPSFWPFERRLSSGVHALMQGTQVDGFSTIDKNSAICSNIALLDCPWKFTKDDSWGAAHIRRGSQLDPQSPPPIVVFQHGSDHFSTGSCCGQLVDPSCELTHYLDDMIVVVLVRNPSRHGYGQNWRVPPPPCWMPFLEWLAATAGQKKKSALAIPTAACDSNMPL